tara:strand:- start:25 stop:204 length:180 start_codon:yes stop_codon:yes gene_type:complete
MAKITLDADQRATLEKSLADVNELIEQGEAAVTADLLTQSTLDELVKQRNRITSMLTVF